MEKILLDTDIGSDIDDALCLAYLLANPACDLLGITTVTGEARKRAMLASVLCRVAGQDIPIYPGVEQPLLTRSQQRRAPQATALPHWDHQKEFPEAGALDFMRRMIRDNPGEITLLCIGPLTNIALLFAYDPELPKLLKRIVLMCGLFMRRLGRLEPLEWNARCDPYAAAMVYRAKVAEHISIGADVTHEVSMPPDLFRARCSAVPLLRSVLDFASRAWQLERDLYFHDPLTACTIFQDDICELLQGNVEVELTSQRLLGFTHWEHDFTTGRHQMAHKVDVSRFFEAFFSVFEGQPA